MKLIQNVDIFTRDILMKNNTIVILANVLNFSKPKPKATIATYIFWRG